VFICSYEYIANSESINVLKSNERVNDFGAAMHVMVVILLENLTKQKKVGPSTVSPIYAQRSEIRMFMIVYCRFSFSQVSGLP